MQVIVTMAGRGLRFSEMGFREPKPLISVGGKPVISYLIDSFPKDWSFIFVMAEHDRLSQLEDFIRSKVVDAKVIYTKYSERGPIDTVLAGIEALSAEEPVLVSYCDLAPVWDAFDFKKRVLGFDMAVVNYSGFHPTYLGSNTYCHVQVDEKMQTVVKLQEKVLFGLEIEQEITSAGIYYFKNKDLLQKALSAQLEQNLKYGNEFYVSLAVQALLNLKSDYQILDYRIQHLIQFGTPADIERFQFWFNVLIEKQLVPDSDISLSKKVDQEKKYWKKVFQSFDVF